MPQTACRRSLTALLGAWWLGSATAQPVPPAPAPAPTSAPSPASAPPPASASELASKGQIVAQSGLAACFRLAPEYPMQARRQNLQGRTMVLFDVSAEGVAQTPRLMRSSGHAVLDHAALTHMASCIGQHTASGSERLPAGRYALPMDWRLE